MSISKHIKEHIALGYPVNGGVLGVSVKDYGAVGDGTTDDAAAINLAIQAAGDGGIVTFESKKTYLVKRPIGREIGAAAMKLPAKLMGNGSTLKTGVAATTTTASLANGGTSVTVSDASQFVVGMMIAFASAGNAIYSDATEITNVNTGTNTLSFNAVALTGGSPLGSGAGVMTSGSVMRFNASHLARTQGLVVQDFVFDGNAASLTAVRRWSMIWGVAFNGLTNLTISNCEFNNFPGEGLFIEDCIDVKVEKCRFNSIFGNGIHAGGTGTGIYQRFINNSFKSCFLANTGTTPTAVQYAHAGACIEGSNGPQETIISGNSFVDSQGWGVGGFDDSSNVRVTVTGNTFKNMRWGAFSITGGVTEFAAVNNTITSCGIDATESGVTTVTHVNGSTTQNWTISGNTFKDSVLVVNTSGRGAISSNSFDVAGLSFGTGYFVAAINLSSSSVANLAINGNYILGSFQVSTDTNLYGIRVIGTAIEVSGNFIHGGRYGIYCSSNITGCAITGNFLSDQRRSTTPSAGILVEGSPTLSGVNITGNTIHCPSTSNTAGYRGISFNGNGITVNDALIANNVIRVDATPAGHRAGIHTAMTAGGAGMRIMDNTIRMNSGTHTAIVFDTVAVAGCHILGNRWVQGTTSGISGATLVYGGSDSNFTG